MKAAGERRGRPKQESGDQADLVESELVANLPEVIPVESGKTTREIAAEKAGFGSATTYRDAKAVVEDATAELVDAVDQGVSSADNL